jgi:hypothetical protein
VDSLKWLISKRYPCIILQGSNNLFYLQCWNKEFLNILAYIYSQNVVHRQLQAHRTLFKNDEKPQIIDSLLMTIMKMVQGVYRFLLCLWRRPILSVCIALTKSLLNYPTYKTKNNWHSVDAYFQNGVERVSLPLLLIKAVHISFTYMHNQSPLQLTKIREYKVLTLDWHWFCHGHICNRQSFHLEQYIVNGIFVSFV